MLGYRPEEFPGRAVFEAYGRGLEVSPDEVYAYAALRPAERREGELWLSGRPDPESEAELAGELVARCDGIEIAGLTFHLEHVWLSHSFLPEACENPRLEVADPPRPLAFDSSGGLV